MMKDLSKYMRVSEVLSRLKDFSRIHVNVLEEKQKIGTEVHKNIYEDNTDGIPLFEEFYVYHALTGCAIRKEKRGKGYFNSYKLWQKENKPQHFLMETRLFCDDLMITGQIDAVATILEERLVPIILDYKCSYTADPVMWNMQAHMYWHLLQQNGHKNVEKFMFLQLDKNGKYPKTHWYKFDQQVLDLCYREITLAWEEKNNAKVLD